MENFFVSGTISIEMSSCWSHLNCALIFTVLRCIFSSVRDVQLIQQEPEVAVGRRSAMLNSWKARSGRDDLTSPMPAYDSTSSRFRKISDIVVQATRETDAGGRKSLLLPSTTDVRPTEPDWHSHLPKNIAVAVTSEQGETLELNTKVRALFRASKGNTSSNTQPFMPQPPAGCTKEPLAKPSNFAIFSKTRI